MRPPKHDDGLGVTVGDPLTIDWRRIVIQTSDRGHSSESRSAIAGDRPGVTRRVKVQSPGR